MNKPYTGEHNGAILTLFVIWLVAAWPVITSWPDMALWYMLLPVVIPFGLLIGAWLLLQIVIVFNWIMEKFNS
ncbi:MAG: hypothetical protein M0R06_19780 [Sphaerochaeta sp.]|nr:hypothetical protein [Sphaerochaeta sp.]